MLRHAGDRHDTVVVMDDTGGAGAEVFGLFGALGVLIFVVWASLIAVAVTNVVLLVLAVIEMSKIPDPVWQYAQRDRTTWLLITILVPFGGFIYWFGVRTKMRDAEATCRAYWAQQYGWTASPPR
jgi:hypothetical protein